MTKADLIEKINNVVEFAYNNSHSSWYRDHCKKYGQMMIPVVKSPDDISALPLITRADINTVSLFNRTFTPIKTANEIRSTSGTTGQSALFYLRDVLYRKIVAHMHEHGARRKLLFWNYNLAASYIHADCLAGLQTVVGDPHQLDKNVKLIEQLAIDTLSGTPSLLMMFGHMLMPFGLNAQIKFMETHGEPCQAKTLSALSQLFPNAVFYSQYSVGEVGQEIGLRLPSCSRQDSHYYHINDDDVYVETVDQELVVTRFRIPTVMPLIRYKTGDSLNWIGYDECDCGHKGLSIELLGRQNVDYVRIAGVELRNELIMNIVDGFKTELDTFVATEIRDEVSNSTQKITINIQVVPLMPQTTDLDDLKRRLQNALLQTLKVSATTSLGEMVAAGLFDIPEIVFLANRPLGNKLPGIKLISNQRDSGPI